MKPSPPTKMKPASAYAIVNVHDGTIAEDPDFPNYREVFWNLKNAKEALKLYYEKKYWRIVPVSISELAPKSRKR